MSGRLGQGRALLLVFLCCACTARQPDETSTLRPDTTRMTIEIAQLRRQVATLEEERLKVDGERRFLQEAFARCSTELAGASATEAHERAAREERLVQAQEKAAQTQEEQEERQRARDACLARVRAVPLQDAQWRALNEQKCFR